MTQAEHATAIRLQLLAANCEQLLANLAQLAAERDELKARLAELEAPAPPPKP